MRILIVAVLGSVTISCWTEYEEFLVSLTVLSFINNAGGIAVEQCHQHQTWIDGLIQVKLTEEADLICFYH